MTATASHRSALQPLTAGFSPDLGSVAATAANEPQFAARLRTRASDIFQQIGFPSTRQEAWRFSKISPIVTTAFAHALRVAPGAGRWRFPDLDPLVLGNGFFDPHQELPEHLAEAGVVVTGLRQALITHPHLIEPHFGGVASSFAENPFIALNTALYDDGVFVFIPEATTLDQPIHLDIVTRALGAQVAAYPRVLVVAGKNSAATLISSFSGDDGSYLCCPVTEIVLSAASRITHYTVQDEIPAAHHMATLAVHQAQESSYHGVAISLGSSTTRMSTDLTLAGSAAAARLEGLYLGTHDQHQDQRVQVTHMVPDCSSDQLYKGVLSQRAQASFTGRIKVAAHAQRTQAEQANHTLVLSPSARVYSNPQLEIFADDVRCTHGSTTGQLDEDALFFLRSRGIDRARAEEMLIAAFVTDVLDTISCAPVRDVLAAALPHRLPKPQSDAEVS